VPPRKYDGIAELFFENLNTAIEVFTDTEYLTKVKPDEERFLDLAACRYVLSNEYPPIIKRYVNDASQKNTKIKFTTLLIRNPQMSFENFVKHHREKHIKLFSSVPIIQKKVLRYVVSHTISAPVPGFPPQKYDGIVEFWFDNIISMISIFIDRKYLATVRPDEKRFLDLKACDFIITRELPPIIG
jgi:EthD protein.